MSATNQTSNYELPLFIGTDKPSWLGDFNGAMNKIDTSIKGNKDEIDSLKTRMTATETVANTASSNASTALTNANTAQSTANTALSNAETADTKAVGAQSTANTALSNASTAQTTADSANSTAQSALALGNSNASDIAKFNLTIFETPTNVTSSVGSISTNTLQVAKNSDGSLGKIYGNIYITGGTTQSSTPVNISFNTSLRPTSEFTIANAGYMRIMDTTGKIGISPVSLTISTSGTVTVTQFSWFNDTSQMAYFLLPCLYWFKDFGDTPIGE